MNPSKIDYTAILLILLYHFKEIRGKSRFMKLSYLFYEKILHIVNPANFEPYYWGAWSAEFYDTLETLDNLGLINVKREGEASSADIIEERRFWEDAYIEDMICIDVEPKFCLYTLTQEGKEIAKKSFEKLGIFEKLRLKDIDGFQNCPMFALLRFIYDHYPYTTISGISKSKDNGVWEEILR